MESGDIALLLGNLLARLFQAFRHDVVVIVLGVGKVSTH